MERFPNPDNIVRPRPGAVRFAPVLTTKNAAPDLPIHAHDAFVNRQGDGVTDTVVSHFHYVRNGRVLPIAGHTHRLTRLPVGAG